jgi:hypothetical protein
MSEISDILKLTYDFSDNESLRAFSDVRLTPFSQNTQDWVNPETGEVFPATFDYYAFLKGERKSDGGYFSVRVVMQHEMIDNQEGSIREAFIKSRLVVAVLSLADFSDCACTPEKPCERHPR